MSAEFREYRPDDWRYLVEMYVSFEPKGVYMGLPPYDADRIAAWLRQLIGEPRNTHFVLWTGRHIIAHAALIDYPQTPRSREVIIFVHQDHQGRGWGRGMLLMTLDRARRELHLDDVWLFVDWHNVRARQLYASLGFQGRPHGIKDSEMLMRRPLAGDTRGDAPPSPCAPRPMPEDRQRGPAPRAPSARRGGGPRS
jgi:RimJ/RimL family protein N-acetyltransferase